MLKQSAYDWNFTTLNDSFASQALAGGQQRQPRGRLLGGSGSINDMVYARGYPADYDDWASTMGHLWNWDNVLPYFKKTERMTDKAIVEDPDLMSYHGTEGDIEVTGSKEPTHQTNVFLNAFEEMGFDIVKDMTNPMRIGAGRFSHTVRKGRRDHSVTALLNKAASRPNLFVVKETLVTKILIDNNTAFGVRALKDGEEFTFYANKEVIVSAGTFNTPKLLMLSGIGPRDHLEELGIDLVTDQPVGGNLQDHIMVFLHMTAKNGTCPSSQPAQNMEVIKYFYDQSGSLAQSDSLGAYFKHSTSQSPWNVPDFAIYPTCVPVASSLYSSCVSIIGLNEEICKSLAKANQNLEIINLALVMLKPASRGNVWLRSTDPLDAPLIYSGTFSAIEDLDLYPEAMEMVLSLANTSYFRSMEAEILQVPLERCRQVTGREYLRCKAFNMATSAWHASGTTAEVVDGRLRVKGVSQLRVVDASVAPSVPRGNTNAPVVMIAEKAADFIKEDHGFSPEMKLYPLWWFIEQSKGGV